MSHNPYRQDRPPSNPTITLAQVEWQIAKHWRAQDDGKVLVLEELVESAGLRVRADHVNRYIRQLEKAEQRWNKKEERASRLLLRLMAEAASNSESNLFQQEQSIEETLELYRRMWQQVQKAAPDDAQALVTPEEMADLLGAGQVPAIFNDLDELVNRLFAQGSEADREDGHKDQQES